MGTCPIRAKSVEAASSASIGGSAVSARDVDREASGSVHHNLQPPTSSSGMHCSPLLVACARGYSDVVAILLETPGGIQTMGQLSASYPRRTPLRDAIFHVHLDCVQLLLEKSSEHGVSIALLADEDGSTPLHAAAFWGRARKEEKKYNSSSAWFLGDRSRSSISLTKGAETWEFGRQVQTTLFPTQEMHRREDHATEILEILLKFHSSNGLTVDVVDNDGSTPLCFAAAASGDQHKWVKCLLDAKASAGIQPRVRKEVQAISPMPWGGTALAEAASRGHTKAVTVLLDHCAQHTSRKVPDGLAQTIIAQAQDAVKQGNFPVLAEDWQFYGHGNEVASGRFTPTSAEEPNENQE